MVFENSFCLRCNRCCLDTEMILLKEDMDRIERLGLRKDTFAVFKNGFYRLRNVEGHCVFLDISTGRCIIYDHRPLGCKIYPLVFDEAEGPTLDPECPLIHRVSCRDIVLGLELLKQFLRKLEIEYRYRIDWKLFEVGKRRLLSRYCYPSSYL